MMRKYSISAVLWLLAAIAIALSCWNGRRVEQQIEISEKKLKAVESERDDYRYRIGLINVEDPSKYYVSRFRDRYSSDAEFRWRIYVPDAAKCDLYYYFGKLPNASFPTEKNKPYPGSLAAGPAEFVVTIENRVRGQNKNRDFRLGFFVEYRNTFARVNVHKELLDPTWMPHDGIMRVGGSRYWRELDGNLDLGAPFHETKQIDLAQPFTILRVSDATEGLVLWLEKTDDSSETVAAE